MNASKIGATVTHLRRNTVKITSQQDDGKKVLTHWICCGTKIMGTTPSQIHASTKTKKTSRKGIEKNCESSSIKSYRKMTKQRILERNPDLLRDRNEINTISGKVKTRKSKSKKFTQKIEPQDSEYGKMNSIGLLIDSPVGNDGRDDFDNPCSNVPDSRVTVNLAMADLMAYLQVVANNSSNLPMTRRDDPDLGRTVSNLTSDDYAEKCAAFIPSDIRIISGSFTKYGRVWDLPTSDEFIPSDATQEPGLSYGGACGNALLKVLYDLESEANNDAATVDYTITANLFDDDSEEEEETEDFQSILNQNNSLESLLMNYDTSQSSITWSDLLRRMKDEMQTIGHCQAPIITGSRKFDINQPFSLIPPDFDSTKNKKRSLLIGCNYKSIPEAQLKASHYDVYSIKDFIGNVHGFPEDDLMTILLDDDSHVQPTHLNIIEAFKALSEQSLPGDAVFVYFSGHGCRVLDVPIDDDVECYDEALIPSDFHGSGMIRDTLIFKTLLAPMRAGVTVTIIIDCCDTGMVLDLPYCWSTKNDRGDVPPKMTSNDDFSFVRFLKVIKTLYESSMFTQLGHTVRSAIYDNPNLTARDFVEDDEDSHSDESGSESLTTLEDNDTRERTSKSSNKSSFMNMLTICQPPPSRKISENLTDITSNEESLRASLLKPPSLLAQVMNCTLLNDPALSDDDSYHRQDTYESYDDPYDSCGSYTDDEAPLHENYYRGRNTPRKNLRQLI